MNSLAEADFILVNVRHRNRHKGMDSFYYETKCAVWLLSASWDIYSNERRHNLQQCHHKRDFPHIRHWLQRLILEKKNGF